MRRILELPPFFIIFTCLTLAPGCDRSEEPHRIEASFFHGKDLAGRTVTLSAPPVRIISLTPSNTEIVFALHEEKRLAAVTEFADYPPQAKTLPRVGDLVTLNLEAIVARDPDLILAGNKLDPDTLRLLEKMEIPTAVTEGTSLDEVYQSIELIGRLVGSSDTARGLTATMRDRVNDISRRVAGRPRPQCYFIVSFGAYGNWTAGPGSFIHEMIELAGGRNAAAGLGQAWGLFSLERLVVIDPDVLLAGKYSGPISQLAEEPGYRDLSAVKKGHVIILNDDLVGRPGPRLTEGLEALARALHPEAFSDEREDGSP
ncbi:MAG TPA: ABC transporter substrate-binding protein [Spirochaetia bacterium]|nr:ABC transporter substrate-binding protein [Spirochaetia bacterium]